MLFTILHNGLEHRYWVKFLLIHQPFLDLEGTIQSLGLVVSPFDTDTTTLSEDGVR